ncbi:GDSL/SGNH-like acyl-esterase family found in Pmr5 and Cas1p-domain-containing protein [Gongronella butleri]|nr:GDSL/SGNH-like acyl-esterase family found in Pmr5 and Cas1p-domain-containing protein [Gongronella butleri]
MTATQSKFGCSQMAKVSAMAVVGIYLLWLVAMPHTEDPRYQLPIKIIHNSNSTNSQAFISLTGGQTLANLCTIPQYTQGEWIRTPVRSRNNAHSFELKLDYTCEHHFHHKCYLRNDKEFMRAKDIAGWRWQPSQCDKLEFDAFAFAKHLSKHPLLLVGDSISQLQYESLTCLLGSYMELLSNPSKNITGGDQTIKPNQMAYAPADVDISSLKKNEPSVAYLRSDHLVRVDDLELIKPHEKEGKLFTKGHNFAWVQALENFDYIILNTGAHWHRDVEWGAAASQDELMDAFRRGMSNVFSHLKEVVQPHQRVFVRSSPFGHAHCSKYKKPVVNPLAPPTGQPGEYEWHMFALFDQVWKEWIDEEQDPRFTFFDVAPMTNLRPDAHSKPDRDCLHTCLPGPVDDWNRFLYHEIGRQLLAVDHDNSN